MRGRQRTDSTYGLGAVKALNHLELVGETLRHALNVLATVAPAWLKPRVQPDWFAQPTCQTCPLRVHCTTAQATGRTLTLRFPPVRHEMLQTARARQRTPEFHDVYRARCGVEGTFAHTTRNTGMRRARYIGQRKTHLQHLFTALATNIFRLVCWLEGTPFARTRTSRFAALAA